LNFLSLVDMVSSCVFLLRVRGLTGTRREAG
jgi:hypothetical protein